MLLSDCFRLLSDTRLTVSFNHFVIFYTRFHFLKELDNNKSFELSEYHMLGQTIEYFLLWLLWVCLRLCFVLAKVSVDD